MKKNVVIVNYNTQKLTNACIMSVNKCTPDCHIFVFDNSNKEPFVNIFNNVEIIDNTKNQIVNFDEILGRHKDFHNRGAEDNNFGSMKHCVSVEKAMEIVDDGFVLIDSDVLIKKDFSNFYNEKKVFVGQKEKTPNFKKRVAPYFVYINVKMCKENGIHFFDENHMFGFYNSNGGENYDTGCWFYESCSNLPKEEISTSPYMVHFRAASWYKEAIEKQHYKQISPEKWLEKYKKYWHTEPENISKNLATISKPREPEPEHKHIAPEEKIMPVEKKKEVEVKYLKMAKTSDRKIGIIKK